MKGFFNQGKKILVHLPQIFSHGPELPVHPIFLNL